MKKSTHPLRRAAWLSFSVPALLAMPAFAQEAPTPPPPVTSTVPAQTTPAAPPAATPAPSVARDSGMPASKTTIAPGAADVVDDARIRQVGLERTVRSAPRAATPRATAPALVAEAAPAPVAETAAPAAAPTTPEVNQAPAATTPPPAETATATDTTTTTTEQAGSSNILLYALIALAVIGGVGFFLWRRNRAAAFGGQYEPEANYYAEPVAAEPVYQEPLRPTVTPATAAAAAAASPVFAAAYPDATADPALVTAEDASVVEAEEAEVAALTDAAAPVHNRPWLEFAMRPIRAGTNVDEALVEIELTVANAGSIAAQDVRVSTFMLTDAHASDMERMLVDPPADAAVAPVTIEPGEGTRIDATLAALKADLGGQGGFRPVVVADARYRLPDGSEGRTSASFVVGVSDAGGTLQPFDLAERQMHDDVEARLHGEPQHA